MSGSEFVLDPDDCTVLGNEAVPEFEDLLAGPAAEVEMRLPDYDPVEAAYEPGWLARIILEEGTAGYLAKKYDPAKHPRWPKGTPKAGKFMRVGEWFEHDGHDWQILHAGDGRVVATEASGKASQVAEKTFTATKATGEGVEIKGVHEVAPKSFDRMSSPIVVPYVKPETHDASIAVPANSHLSAVDWKRFGKDDQDYYVSLQDRFGEWNPQKSKQVIGALWNGLDYDVQHSIMSAFDSQYGSQGFWTHGAGKWLNLAYMVEHSKSNWPGYAKAKVSLDEINEVVHWDLYNRVKAPDIALMHGGGSGVYKYQQDFISGKTPIYAGFSQSYAFSGATSWGSTILLTPTAIRHVSLSMYTPMPGTSAEAMGGEKEIAVGVRMKLDDRSVAFDSGDMGMGHGNAALAVNKWLSGETNQQPAPGSIVQTLKDIWNGTGPIPLPEEKPNLVPVGAANAPSYQELPLEIAVKAGGMAHKLKYKSDDGSKEAAVGILDGMGLVPGDFIEGKQGTRYVIVADASDSTSGLRYVKVEKSGEVNYTKSYPFDASAGNEFYRLDGHLDIPKPKAEAGFVPYGKEQYDLLAKGALTKLGDLKTGSLVNIDGDAYKVTGKIAGKTSLESLDTGKKYNGNSLAKIIPLVPMPGFEVPAGHEQPYVDPALKFTPDWKVGDHVTLNLSTVKLYGEITEQKPNGQFKLWTPAHPGGVTASGSQLGVAPKMPGVGANASNAAAFALAIEPGDKFQLDGVGPYTVTTVLKSGTIKAKLAGGNVKPFNKSDLFGKTIVYRPSTFAIGDKVKVGLLDIGDTVQGGGGDKIRPYVVQGHFMSKVYLRNLETGDIVAVTKNKTYRRLLDAPTIKAQEIPAPGEKPAGHLGPIPVETGAVKKLGDMEVGEGWLLHNNSNDESEVTGYALVTGEMPDGSKHIAYTHFNPKLSNINETTISPGSGAFDLSKSVALMPSAEKVAAKPELGSKFDMSKYVEGDTSTLSDLDVGSLFVSATGLPMQLKSKAPKGGATAIALHNGKTVKNIAYDKPFATLVEKPSVPFDHSQLKPGESVLAKHLQAGDHFKLGISSFVIELPASGDQDAKVKAIGASGKPVPWPGTIGPEQEVTYLGKFVESAPPKAVNVTDYHADALPTAPGFETYLHPKSGKHKYPLVKEMPAGTVFTDKSGKAWKVKQTGGQTVVAGSDQKLYKVNSDWRGKVSEGDVAFIDNPQHGGDAPGGLKIGDLKVGDQFTIPAGYAGAGMIYEIVDDSPTWHAPMPGYATDHPVYGGFHTIMAKKLYSGAIDPISTSLPAQGVVSAPEPPTAKVLTGTVPSGAMSIADLPEGAEFPNHDINGDQLWKSIDPQATMKKLSHGGGAMVVSSPTHPKSGGGGWSVAASSPKGQKLVVPSGGVSDLDLLLDEPSVSLANEYGTWGKVPVGTHFKSNSANEPPGIVYKVTGKNENGVKVTWKKPSGPQPGHFTYLPTEGIGGDMMLVKRADESAPASGFSKQQYNVLEDFPIGTTVHFDNGDSGVVEKATDDGKIQVVSLQTNVPIKYDPSAFIGAVSDAEMSGKFAQVGDKVTDHYKTFGEIPAGTYITSGNADTYKIKQATTKTHFLTSMGGTASKFDKDDPPIALWKIAGLPGDPWPGTKATTPPPPHPHSPLFKATSTKVSKEGMLDFDLGTTPSGVVVYKALSGKLFPLGKAKPYTGNALLHHTVWDGPDVPSDPASLMPTGAPDVPLTALKAGDFFGYQSGRFMVLGTGPDGVTARRIGTPKISFASYDSGKLVTPVMPKSSAADPGVVPSSTSGKWQQIAGASDMKAIGDIPDGAIFEYANDNSNTIYKVTAKANGKTHIGMGPAGTNDSPLPDHQALFSEPVILNDPSTWQADDLIVDNAKNVWKVITPLNEHNGVVLSKPGGITVTMGIAPLVDEGYYKVSQAVQDTVPPSPADEGAALPKLKELKDFVNGQHAWTLGGQHGVVTGFGGDKTLKMDDGTEFVPTYELYVDNPLPPQPIPGGYKVGDKIITKGAGAENGPGEVVGPGEAGLGGHVIFKYLKGPLAGVEGAASPTEIEPWIDHVAQGTIAYGDLLPGDHFTTSVGAGAGDVWIKKRFGMAQLVKKKLGSAELANEGDSLPGPYDHSPVTFVPDNNPLVPYLHPKSGKLHYDELSTLAPGTQFTDKHHGHYEVVGHVGGVTQFKDVKALMDDADAKTFAAPSTYRVKVVAPPLDEAVVVGMDGYGRLCATTA